MTFLPPIAIASVLFLVVSISRVQSWQKDLDINHKIPRACDIPEYSHDNLPSDLGWDAPFIVRDYSKSWKARAKWNKENLTRLYGNRKIVFGSEHSIVYGGGSAELTSNFSEFLHNMERNNTENNLPQFVFQPSILTDIPELK